MLLAKFGTIVTRGLDHHYNFNSFQMNRSKCQFYLGKVKWPKENIGKLILSQWHLNGEFCDKMPSKEHNMRL
jgi:hypothetical protein